MQVPDCEISRAFWRKHELHQKLNFFTI